MTNFSNSSAATVQRYVDILTNGGFKALFGDVNNKEAVMSILNVLLPEHRKLSDIDYLPTERQGQIVDVSKEYQYDFMCRDKSGAVFIVELQKYHEDYWFKRCVSYACRAYDRQTRKGEDYDVPPVYLVGLMDVEIEHPDKEFWKNRYISEYTFREKECSDLLGETIVIIFAEMANFSKTEEECETETDKMLFLLKNIGKMMSRPAWLQHEVYSRIFDACEIAGFTEDKRIQYEKEMYDERRRKSEMDTAKRIGFETGRAEGRAEGREEGRAEGRVEGREEGRVEGREEGRAEGREEGRAEGRVEGRAEGRVEGRAEGRVEGRAEGRVEGRAEGRVEGREEGREEEQIRIARNLKLAEVDIDTILNATGLDKETVDKL